MNYGIIKKGIKNYQTIIIHRHLQPDLDALGSQLGLKEAILATYFDKEVYVVGDENDLSRRVGAMDNISDDKYDGALVIVVDAATQDRVFDDRFKSADEVIIIDHHANQPDIDRATVFIDTGYESTTAFLADILFELDFGISPKCADLLMMGIVGDTDRFRYIKDGVRLFEISAKLMKLGANPVALYDWLYLEKPEVRLMKYDFQSRIKIEDGVAFLKNSKEDVAKHPDVDISVMSKEVAGSMLEIEGVLIGANFTFSSEQGVILGEFRSRGVKIVDVAKKYGGGGHDMACGASLANWDLVDAVIEDFKKMVKLRG